MITEHEPEPVNSRGEVLAQTDNVRVAVAAIPASVAAIRTVAALAAFTGLGFGIPGAFGMSHFARSGDVWTSMGFPTYGQGPFKTAGIPTSVPLLGAFVVVCAAEVVTAALLWRGTRAGMRLSLGLLPAELIFWIGFALPFGPPVAVARTIAILYATRHPKNH